MDLDVCRTAILKSFPELSIERIQSLDQVCEYTSEGWDSYAFVVNGEFIFKCPKHHYGADSLRLQAKLLPRLKNCLTIPIPELEFISHGRQGFQEALVGYRMIEGMPLTGNLFRETCTEKVAQDLASQLAEFLSELHQFPIERAKKLGVPSVPDKERWADFYRDIEKSGFPLLDRPLRLWTTELFENFLSREDNFHFQPVLTHGDLSPEHILFDREGKRISGVIDFGDVRIGDPAYDFQFDYGDDFLRGITADYQGEIDEAFPRRLQFYNRRWPFHEILYGQYSRRVEHIERGMENLRNIVSAEK